MQQGFVVHRLFLPADQNPSEAIHPRGNALDYPPPSAAASGSFCGLLLATRLDVRPVAPSAGFAAKNCSIISLVATQMLRPTCGGARSPNRKIVQRGMKESLVMRIGAGNRHAQRHTAAIGQHRSLDTRFAPIRRVSAGFFPRPREPWWSSRRDFATSIGCREGRHIVATDTSRACGTRGVAPTPGSSGATNCRNRTRWEPLSIGSRFAGHRRCRRRLSATPTVAGLPAGRCGSAAGTTPCAERPSGIRQLGHVCSACIRESSVKDVACCPYIDSYVYT